MLTTTYNATNHKLDRHIDTVRKYLKPDGLEEHKKNSVQHLDGLRHRTFINCWHMNSHESFLMWRTYVGYDLGVAIQTTYDRLKSCLPGDDPGLLMGRVTYVDHDIDDTPGDIEHQFFQKRLYFEAEQEFRALFVNPGNSYISENDTGIRVPMNYSKLLKRCIYLQRRMHGFTERCVGSSTMRE